MPQGSSAARPTNGLYLYLLLPCTQPYAFHEREDIATGKPSPFSSLLIRLLFGKRNNVLLHATRKDKIGVVYDFCI